MNKVCLVPRGEKPGQVCRSLAALLGPLGANAAIPRKLPMAERCVVTAPHGTELLWHHSLLQTAFFGFGATGTICLQKRKK